MLERYCYDEAMLDREGNERRMDGERMAGPVAWRSSRNQRQRGASASKLESGEAGTGEWDESISDLEDGVFPDNKAQHGALG